MVPSVGTEAQSLRTTEETIQPNNKDPGEYILFGSFVSFVMTVPAIRPQKRAGGGNTRNGKR